MLASMNGRTALACATIEAILSAMPTVSLATLTVTEVFGSALSAVMVTPGSSPVTVVVEEVTSKAPGPVPTRSTVSVPADSCCIPPSEGGPDRKAPLLRGTSDAEPVDVDVTCRRCAPSATWTAVAPPPVPVP